MMMKLNKTIKEIIKKEIKNDPTNRGYAGKTPAEIANLLNVNYKIIREENYLPRIFEILIGVPFAPNIITAEQIAQILGGE